MRRSLSILAALFIVVSRPVFSEHRTESIGMLLPLSGAYASVGADNRAGIDAALAERSGASGLSLVFADSQAEPRHSVSEFRKLSESDGVFAVYAMRGPVGMAVNPLSRRMKMPLVGGVGNRHFTTGNEFAFQAWPTSEREGDFLAEQLKLAGVKRVSVVTVEDDWPIAVSEVLASKAAQNGLSVVGEWRVLPTESDFRALSGRLKRDSADAIFLNVGIAQIGPFVKQVRDLGVTTQIYSNFWAAKAEVRAAGGDRLRGVRYVEMRTDSPALPSGASGATLSAYVAMHLLLQARVAIEGPLTRASLFTALSAQREVATRAGAFAVINRQIQFPMVVREIR